MLIDINCFNSMAWHPYESLNLLVDCWLMATSLERELDKHPFSIGVIWAPKPLLVLLKQEIFKFVIILSVHRSQTLTKNCFPAVIEPAPLRVASCDHEPGQEMFYKCIIYSAYSKLISIFVINSFLQIAVHKSCQDR